MNANLGVRVAVVGLLSLGGAAWAAPQAGIAANGGTSSGGGNAPAGGGTAAASNNGGSQSQSNGAGSMQPGGSNGSRGDAVGSGNPVLRNTPAPSAGASPDGVNPGLPRIQRSPMPNNGERGNVNSPESVAARQAAANARNAAGNANNNNNNPNVTGQPSNNVVVFGNGGYGLVPSWNSGYNPWNFSTWFNNSDAQNAAAPNDAAAQTNATYDNTAQLAGSATALPPARGAGSVPSLLASSPDYQRADADVTVAQSRYDAEQRRVLGSLGQKSDYSDAVKAQDRAHDAAAAFRRDHPNATPEQLAPFANDVLKADQQVTKLQGEALAADRAASEAKAKLDAASQRRNQIRGRLGGLVPPADRP